MPTLFNTLMTGLFLEEPNSRSKLCEALADAGITQDITEIWATGGFPTKEQVEPLLSYLSDILDKDNDFVALVRYALKTKCKNVLTKLHKAEQGYADSSLLVAYLVNHIAQSGHKVALTNFNSSATYLVLESIGVSKQVKLTPLATRAVIEKCRQHLVMPEEMSNPFGFKVIQGDKK